MQRFFSTLATVFTVVSVLFVTSVAGAAPAKMDKTSQPVVTIKPELQIASDDLEGFQKGCMLGADKSIPADKTAQYCSCVKIQVSQTVNREEYRDYNARLFDSSARKQPRLPEDVFRSVEQRMSASVTACSALLDTDPVKNIR